MHKYLTFDQTKDHVKNKLIYIFYLFLLISCTTKRNLAGVYEVSGKDFEYKITLQKDHKFLLNEGSFDGSSECEGTWQSLHKDTILLQCEDEGVVAMLQRGYMLNRNQKLIWLNRNQIQFQNCILTKTITSH